MLGIENAGCLVSALLMISSFMLIGDYFHLRLQLDHLNGWNHTNMARIKAGARRKLSIFYATLAVVTVYNLIQVVYLGLSLARLE